MNKIKHARTALRWGLGLFVTGLISFILAISLIERPLETPIYIDVLAMTGVILACLGFLTFTIVSLTFIPSILKSVVQHTEQHQNNESLYSVTIKISKGIGIFFITLFKIWAILVSHTDTDDESQTDTRFNQPIDGDIDVDAYYNNDPFYAFLHKQEDSSSKGIVNLFSFAKKLPYSTNFRHMSSQTIH